ncbi:conserved Plasmodium protein, unknown function [Plasmodium yoelii]|uniref:Uncharacterized protein n=2 Tax=Plasmodium yoelii TaxID=5861 RepID=A0AAF0B440_PLAYO|nr:conserved Plasmodium protein, unknown function [Plasmodium yoelii]WBY56280.1 hypothetical protein Py17XNL_000704152 [Plasmodium yoelii yoelii]CDU17180.1 conserved Plasmodium protein, unknown function [Plasmodium yoelii]VTZ76299.1 conserved Plasmodium protein, unknown function [Plasmodium yoelii]|eukprot:XP_731088.2 conserved Plasmodium protein, unknown function [Plasmodium yoelii]
MGGILLNNLLEELLGKWKEKKINLYNVCYCFNHIKNELLGNQKNRKGLFLNDIHYEILTFFFNLLECNNNTIETTTNINWNSDQTRSICFYISFVTFIFNVENEFIKKNNQVVIKHIEEEYLKEHHEKDKIKKLLSKNKNNSTIGLETQNVQKPSIEKNDKKLNTQENDNTIIFENELNSKIRDASIFEKIDMIIKTITHLNIPSTLLEGNNDKDDNANSIILSLRLFALYGITEFVFLISQYSESVSKQYHKHIKNVLIYIINMKVNKYNDYLIDMANIILLYIVNINYNIIKDYEKVFFNFLFIQLKRKGTFNIGVEQNFITYLQKKDKSNLNDEIYKNINDYGSDNINLFLKYKKNEYLYAFLNSIHLFKNIIHAKISNNDENIFTTNNSIFININLSIKDIINNIHMLLEYLSNFAKKWISNKDLDFDTFCNKDENSTPFTIENCLNNEKMSDKFVNDNIFKYVTDKIFSFFRGLIKEMDTELISLNAHIFVNFMKHFFIYNNECDLFLVYFLDSEFILYFSDLLIKCPSIFEEWVLYIMHIFRSSNLLIQNKISFDSNKNDILENRKGENTILNILNKIKNIYFHQTDLNKKLTDIYFKLYNNYASILLIFLKHIKSYINEEIKNKILIHYEHFLFNIFDKKNNLNFDLIFNNTISTHLTLKILFTFFKVKILPFQNIHNFYFKLANIKNYINQINKSNSFLYKNQIVNNSLYIEKIQTFLLNNLDTITINHHYSIYNKKKKNEILNRITNISDQTDNEQEQNSFNKSQKNKKNKKKELNTQYDEFTNYPTFKKIKNISKQNEEFIIPNDDPDFVENQIEHNLPSNENQNYLQNSDNDIHKIKKKKKSIGKSHNSKEDNNSKEDSNSIDDQTEDMTQNYQVDNSKQNINSIIENKTNQEKIINSQKHIDSVKNSSSNNNEENNFEPSENINEKPSEHNKKTIEKINKFQKKKNKIKNIDKYNNLDKSSQDLKELADNIKIVSSSDAMKSLKYMKQSILNDL